MTGLETWLAAQGLSFGYDRAKAGWSYKNSTKRKGFWADISDISIGAGNPDLERQNEEKRRKKIIADQQKKLMDAATLQTEAQRGQLNAQLAEATNQLNIQKAGMGAYRTGGRIKDISSMQTKTNEAVARVAKENVLQATLAGLGLEGNEQNYQLQLAKLEIAKQEGDTDQMAGIAEQIGNSDFFTKLFQTQKPSSTVEEMAGGTLLAPSDPFSNEMREEIPTGSASNQSGGLFNRLTGIRPPAPTGEAGSFSTPSLNYNTNQVGDLTGGFNEYENVYGGGWIPDEAEFDWITTDLFSIG